MSTAVWHFCIENLRVFWSVAKKLWLFFLGILSWSFPGGVGKKYDWSLSDFFWIEFTGWVDFWRWWMGFWLMASKIWYFTDAWISPKKRLLILHFRVLQWISKIIRNNFLSTWKFKFWPLLFLTWVRILRWNFFFFYFFI